MKAFSTFETSLEYKKEGKLKKNILILVFTVISLLCTFIILIFGSTCTIKKNLPNNVTGIDQIDILVENDLSTT